ncbi:MAG: hypothetical protein HPPSJP_4420 [Candidatus Hepatoplasma scabrum]|nr:MAG: hypothetical protein HPPSJP_4420 [Candidatus Hepatoplasma sp.]
MSRKCDILNKGPQYGNSRSKSLNASKKKWDVNLQSIKVAINGKEQKLMLSTKMIRTLKNKSKENIILINSK